MTTHLWTRGGLAAVRLVLALALALVTWGGTAFAQGQPPVIDGNGEDLILYASGLGEDGCVVDRSDPRDDIVVADPKIDPCATVEDTDGDAVNDYYVNGKDLRRLVSAYDVPNQDLYILFRVEGVIGDVDGNGDPDNALCIPPANFNDQPGIGSEDTYEARYDLNCDGESDLLVRIENNQVTVLGLQFGSASFDFNGSDLEVAILDIELPSIYQVFAFSGAIRDGLGEDITPVTQCGSPTPNIDLQKSVEPAILCAGQTADFTITVTNNGNVDLANVTVVDDLPAGLAFVSTVSNTCGGPVNQAGNQITYGPFDLATGASCTIVIRASRSAECAGEQTNNAVVQGSFSSPCVNGGEPTIISDKASASLVCGDVTCSISAPVTEVCAGQTVEICGPEGNFGYAWSTGATSRCIDVGAGTYSLVITDLASGCVSSNECSVTIREIECGDNCPRTVGFWGAQCAQRGNGSAKFTSAQMTQIAECVDEASSFFSWSAGTDFDFFCRNINPPSPMTQRRQAKRQFAGVLANLCVTSLGLTPSQGGSISLDPSTPIDCDGLDADTIGELIDEVDDILADLEGEDLNDPAVKEAYGELISCLDAINNGTNIPTSSECEGDDVDPSAGIGAVGSIESLSLLHRAVPNPFTGSMSYAYEVVGGDQTVDIGVYNVAGRLVKSLAKSTQPAGRHTATWNGTDEAGARVPGGVYFVRVRLGAETQQHRVIFLGN
jgi:uncharacterized repeat protein (TIGR01451 family)